MQNGAKWTIEVYYLVNIYKIRFDSIAQTATGIPAMKNVNIICHISFNLFWVIDFIIPYSSTNKYYQYLNYLWNQFVPA